MRVFVRREEAENIIVFVDGLAEVAALLLVPPVRVRVAELPLLRGRVDVASVLERQSLSEHS